MRDDTSMSFTALVRTATGGHEPYAYQLRLADEGLPELLSVPTGAGKTLAGVLPWLYRRRFHPDPTVRADTPHWLVFVLPMRVLAEQTVDVVRTWLERLGLRAEVECHLLMGGEPRTNPWRRRPEADTVIVGTLDMVVSRQLNRAYGETRFVWPIDFGLFNNGCQFVFDEVQLMGPALATSRQLHGLRARLGTASACRSMWMSATIDERALTTVDAPTVGDRVGLTEADRTGGLARRLDATRRVVGLPVDARRVARDVSAHVMRLHRDGTLTLVIHNTVDRAQQTYVELAKAAPRAELVLLHSRFRPDDRAKRVKRALAPVDADGPGRIVVSTQVVEAGVDISAATLVTEAAPWPSIVQRAGRCNRDGTADDAVLAWFPPPRPAPYAPADVDAATGELERLEGELVTSTELGRRPVKVEPVIVPVLRRKDLLELFDTAPDLSGNDVDVARFIRDADDLDAFVAWRSLPPGGPGEDEPLPGRRERCPVPVAQVRALIGDVRLWTYDHLASRWRAARHDDVRPGAVFLLDAAAGRYDALTGWTPGARDPVEPVRDEPLDEDRAMEDDPATTTGEWTPLRRHLADVEEAVRAMLDSLDHSGLSSRLREAAILAGRYHDVGKAHPAFQAMLRSTAADGELSGVPPGEVLAKSAGTRRGRYDDRTRRYFRHELASALALEARRSEIDLGDDPDLVTYLVAAHHGRIRLGCRPHPKEGDETLLGIHLAGDSLPTVALPGSELPGCALSIDVLAMGETNGTPSWTARALGLRDRADVGPFRLGFLEAVVRLADWRASARPSSSQGSSGA